MSCIPKINVWWVTKIDSTLGNAQEKNARSSHLVSIPKIDRLGLFLMLKCSISVEKAHDLALWFKKLLFYFVGTELTPPPDFYLHDLLAAVSKMGVWDWGDPPNIFQCDGRQWALCVANWFLSGRWEDTPILRTASACCEFHSKLLGALGGSAETSVPPAVTNPGWIKLLGSRLIVMWRKAALTVWKSVWVEAIHANHLKTVSSSKQPRAGTQKCS